MKRALFYSVLLSLSMSILCCSQERPKDSKILARINDYSLTLDEFERQLTEELELDKDFKMTKEAKQEFLEELIRKELLIQEAKKLQLDRKDEFVRAIERYWESTLIRDLIDTKSKDIEERTYVSEEEIQARYAKMQKPDKKLPPLKEMYDDIAEELKKRKKSRILKEWIASLRKNATIEINEELL